MDIEIVTFLMFITCLLGIGLTCIGFADDLKVCKFGLAPCLTLSIWSLLSYLIMDDRVPVNENLEVNTVDNIDLVVDRDKVLNLNSMFNRDFEEGDIIIKETDPSVMSLGVYYDEEVSYEINNDGR